MNNKQKYLHICRENVADEILTSGTLDNSKAGHSNQHMMGNEVYVIDKKGGPELVKAFMWDIEKISESKYLRTAPWVSEEFIKFKKVGTFLGIIPKMIHTYDIEAFRAIVFNVSSGAQKIIEHGYMREEGEKGRIYVESASYKPIKMRDTQELNIKDVCNQILGMAEPYATYLFTEGDDGYGTRDLIPDTKVVRGHKSDPVIAKLIKESNN